MFTRVECDYGNWNSRESRIRDMIGSLDRTFLWRNSRISTQLTEVEEKEESSREAYLDKASEHSVENPVSVKYRNESTPETNHRSSDQHIFGRGYIYVLYDLNVRENSCTWTYGYKKKNQYEKLSIYVGVSSFLSFLCIRIQKEKYIRKIINRSWFFTLHHPYGVFIEKLSNCPSKIEITRLEFFSEMKPEPEFRTWSLTRMFSLQWNIIPQLSGLFN